MTPLERLYPNRCFDCLSMCEPDKVLCARCEQVYADERARRAGHNASPEGDS